MTSNIRASSPTARRANGAGRPALSRARWRSASVTRRAHFIASRPRLSMVRDEVRTVRRSPGSPSSRRR